MRSAKLSIYRGRPLGLCALTALAVGITAMTQPVGALESARSYVIILEPGAADASVVAAEHSATYGVDVAFIYREAIIGYSATMTEAAAALVAADARVSRVADDVAVELNAQTIPTGVDRVYDPVNNNTTAPGLHINGVDDKRVDVDIAIIDTGIDNTHLDLNVAGGTDCAQANTHGECADGFSQPGVHGTHVAGVAAALDNGVGVVGVAPGARLWSVKVVGSNGAKLSSLLAGIDWVTARSQTIEVANISLGCKLPCPDVNLAIGNSTARGVTYTIAAGNSGQDSSLAWPANSPEAITVSAIADGDGRSGAARGSFFCSQDQSWFQDDTLASFSNFGPPIDIAAPGVCINSTVDGGGYWAFSGTSTAAPHVAGAAGLLASQAAFRGQPASIKQALIDNANLNWVDTSGDGFKEPLLDVTRFTPVTVSIVNEPPKASFTKSCSGATCTFSSTSTDPDGTIKSWSWNFGDGYSGTGPTVTHTYPAGKYTVTLTVVDSNGAVATASQSVSCSTQKGRLSCR